MKEVLDFIKSCGVYYLATLEGDQPRVRPFGTVLLSNVVFTWDCVAIVGGRNIVDTRRYVLGQNDRTNIILQSKNPFVYLHHCSFFLCYY